MNRYELNQLFVLCEKLGIKTLKDLSNFKIKEGITTNCELLQKLSN